MGQAGTRSLAVAGKQSRWVVRNSVPAIGLALVLAVLVASSMARPTTAAAEWIELTPVRDNTLFETTQGETSSGIGPSLFFGQNGQSSVRRALLAFDFTELAVGSRIDSVSLRIHVSQAPNETPQALTVHKVLAPWGEGESSAPGGNGAPSQAGDATWLHRFFPDSLWSAPGGDFSASASASGIVGSVGSYTVADSGLVADVVSWLAEPGTDYGWLLRGNEVELSSARKIDSREAADSTLWPRLTVHFTPPVPVETMTWGHLKALFGNE